MVKQASKPVSDDVETFLAQVEDPTRRADSRALVKLMQDVSGEEPVLWGTMIGFGRYHYRYPSGHEGDAFLIGFSPRKTEFSIYLMGTPEDDAPRQGRLAKLGKHRMGKGCLYVKRLSDIDMEILRDLAESSVTALRAAYPPAKRKGRSVKPLQPQGMLAGRAVEGLGDKRQTQHTSLTGCMGRLPCQ